MMYGTCIYFYFLLTVVDLMNHEEDCASLSSSMIFFRLILPAKRKAYLASPGLAKARKKKETTNIYINK